MKKIVLHQENIEILLESLLNKDDADSLEILEEYQSHDGEHSIINYLLLNVKDHLVKKGYSEEDIIEKIRNARLNGFTHYMIVVAEGSGSASEIAAKIKESIGVVFQDSRLDRALTVRDNLFFRGALYGLEGKELQSRIDEVTELLELGDILRVKHSSSGIASIICTTGSGSSTGTGVVITKDGYIVTNAHVVEGAANIQVILNDERVLDAVLVGADEVSDLAVLKVDVYDLIPAELGDSNVLRVGDAVVAIGDPLGIFRYFGKYRLLGLHSGIPCAAAVFIQPLQGIKAGKTALDGLAHLFQPFFRDFSRSGDAEKGRNHLPKELNHPGSRPHNAGHRPGKHRRQGRNGIVGGGF